MTNIWRQGDVIVREVSEIPEDATPSESNEVRISSETGHSHTLLATKVFVSKDQKRGLGQQLLQYIVVLDEPKEMVHPQHAPLELSPGRYLITTVRDYAPMRRALD
jgi:hypothetical protein